MVHDCTFQLFYIQIQLRESKLYEMAQIDQHKLSNKSNEILSVINFPHEHVDQTIIEVQILEFKLLQGKNICT